MAKREVSLQEALSRILDYSLANTFVSMPALIESYDPDKQTATVKPLFSDNYEFIEGQSEQVKYAVISSVPVIFPRGNDFFISLPLKRGDSVLLLFLDRSIDELVESTTQEVIVPRDLRKHSLSDAVAIPSSIYRRDPISNVDPEKMVIGHESGKFEMHIDKEGVVSMKATEVKLGGHNASIPVGHGTNIEARLTALESFMGTHVHGDINPFPPPLLLPNPLAGGKDPITGLGFSAASGTAKSMKVKIDE